MGRGPIILYPARAVKGAHRRQGLGWGDSSSAAAPRARGKRLPGAASEDWPELIAKCTRLDREFEGWSPVEVASVAAPVLLIIGDSDIVRPEHAVEAFRLLGGGVEGESAGLPSSQLAVLPGTTHLTIVERADWLVSIVLGFLDTPLPQRI